MIVRKNLFAVGHKTNLGKKLPNAGFSKGNTPWNKGTRLPEDYRKKLSMAHVGQSAWNKGKGLRKKFSDLQEYKLWRTSVYQRDCFTCQICGKLGGRLNAHHIFPISLFPKMVFEIDNGKTLCLPCHKLTDSFGLAACNKRRELQERLSKLTCSEAWAETLRNVQRLGVEAKANGYAGNAPTSALTLPKGKT